MKIIRREHKDGTKYHYHARQVPGSDVAYDIMDQSGKYLTSVYGDRGAVVWLETLETAYLHGIRDAAQYAVDRLQKKAG